MQRNDLEAWLGDDWTTEQTDRIADAFGDWERANPEADDEDREAMLVAISQHIDGTLNLADLGRAHAEAVNRAAAAKVALRSAVQVLVPAGMGESEAAREGLVDRMTVRKWLGKR